MVTSSGTNGDVSAKVSLPSKATIYIIRQCAEYFRVVLFHLCAILFFCSFFLSPSHCSDDSSTSFDATNSSVSSDARRT